MKLTLIQQGLLLEYITLFWNIIGCSVVMMLGLTSHSLSLFGFGVDSVIEILASVVVIWQLKSINQDKEKVAEKLIGISFILLSLYITVQAYFGVTQGAHPKASLLGIVFLSVTAMVMFALAYGKKVVGYKLNNSVLIAESKVTVIDGLLAVSVLIGLVLNAVFGFWWMDIVSSFVIVWYGIREAIHVLR